METDYFDHKDILKQEESKLIYCTIILAFTIILAIAIVQRFQFQWMINLVALLVGAYLAHKENNLMYFKWILSIIPAVFPYQLCNSFDGSIILFGMMHTVLNPIFCIFLSKSFSQTLILIMANIIGNHFYLQPQLFIYLNIENNELKKYTIHIAFGLSFIIIIIYTSGLWYLFESRKNILEKLCKGKKEIHQMNEQLTLANKLLSDNLKSNQELLLHVSHEIRNSLNIISGSCELAIMDAIVPKVKVLLTKISSSVEIITYFLNNLLDGAKLGKNGLEVIPKATNTWEFMQKLWNTACILIERKSLRAKMFVDKKIPTELNIDPMRVTQIIYNLVGNASKFTMNGYVGIVVTWIPKYISNGQIHEEQGSWEVYFRQTMLDDDDVIIDNNQIMLTSQDQFNDIKEYSKSDTKKLRNFSSYTLDQYIKTLYSKFFLEKYIIISDDSEKIKPFLYSDYISNLNNDTRRLNQDVKVKSSKGILKIEVIDSGCGMDSNQVSKLFEEYSQVGTSHQRQMGTGLGLVISKMLCNLMGGNLEVNSKPECGTTFIATILLTQYSGVYQLYEHILYLLR